MFDANGHGPPRKIQTCVGFGADILISTPDGIGIYWINQSLNHNNINPDITLDSQTFSRHDKQNPERFDFL